MRALGIDAGCRRLGWAVVEVVEGGFAVVAKGLLEEAHPDPYRLAKILSGIVLGKASEYNVDVCHIERQGSNMPAKFVEAMIGGELREAGFETTLQQPSRVKKLVAGDGRSDKASVRDAVTRLTGETEFASPDVSDACAIAIAGMIDSWMEATGYTEQYEKERKAAYDLSRYSYTPRMKPYHKDRTPTSNMDGVKGRAK